MTVIDVALEVIDDNPYNPRKHYPHTKVKEMAQSLREVGLLQVPEGRHVDGRVQLAYGHMRLRGFGWNLKHDPYPENEKWKTMPVYVKEISDQDMFHFSMEENLRRSDITPIEVARCIEAFSGMFPNVTEKELGEKHGMSEANVSNMKRVLRLPEKFLEKIDQEVISFTQGRELLTLEGLENAENLMASALGGLRTGNKSYGHANTVEGLQASIHSVISGDYRPLDKEWEGYRWNILFDTRAAGCLKCDKMMRTHPNKSQAAHYCTDGECWDRHQQEHRDKAAVAAKATMEAEVVNRAAQAIAQEEKAPPPAPVMLDENTVLVDQETFAKIEASYSADRISEGTAVKRPVAFEDKLYVATSGGMGKVEAYQLVPREGFTGQVRTYKVAAGREGEEYYESLRNDPNGFYHRMLVKRGQVEHVLVGPPVTFVTEVDEGDFSQEKLLEQDASRRIAEAPAPTPQAIPEDILALAREKAGTRAEVLDLNDICSGESYYRQMKQGYVDLSADLRLVDDPAECLERCTHGFHYAFDSKARDPQKVLHVCSDTKCLAKKKGAFTRKVNAEGQARKKAETKAIKETIAQTTTLDRPRIKLILLAQMDGRHAQRYYYGGGDGKQPETWLWEKISAGTAAIARKREDLFKRIDKLTDEELAKLVVEFMFYYLVDQGDIGTWKIKTETPLEWLGVKIELLGDKDHD